MSVEPQGNLVLLNDAQVFLAFDPVDVSDCPESVAFNVSLTWTMPFQHCTFVDRQRWFDNESLRQFELDLVHLADRESGQVVLRHMSQKPVLEIDRKGDAVQIRFHAEDTFGMGSFAFVIRTYASVVAEMRDRWRSYPKWW